MLIFLSLPQPWTITIYQSHFRLVSITTSMFDAINLLIYILQVCIIIYFNRFYVLSFTLVTNDQLIMNMLETN
jgi:hypothetical protein